MKTIIGEWIVNLVIIAILAVLMDMILPNGNMKKFTGLLFGLIILIMFLQPLLQLIGQASDLEVGIFQNYLTQSSEAAAFYSNQTEKSQRENLEQIVKENLEKDLEMELQYRGNLDNVKVNIVFDQVNGAYNFSEIRYIEVTASLKSQQIWIDPVIIGRDKKTSDIMVDDIVMGLKEYISQLYDIDSDSIYIKGY
jgi:stage III sporulation protein AF